ncbi:MAG: Glycosyl transferase family 2 [candidate division WS6 bacterium GW2011_GWA2_37_6]|uniref:Glycosyl transferase family 2 n=1 Tax=candidate division WS6 bacterium GW2011_GWA2_37_6 TaxID=1619087 RepID=A0A0G0GVB5_9BACT|nr:MAG: Glycosyl transferase family 2 [candidate division WS6 bacterium GW2011_GWA2_37_6]
MQKVTIVIPTYNEKKNINNLLNRIAELNASIRKNYHLEIIFVDDSSPDGTVDEINRLKNKQNYSVHIVQREGKLGLGTAYIRGFKEALENDSDIIIEMDADLSHDPLAISRILEKIEQENIDFVIGSRYTKGGKLPKWSPSRKAISWSGNLYARLILGFQIHDWTGGFNAYKKEVLQKIDLDNIKSNGYAFQIEMKYKAKKAGFRPGEVPIEFHDRVEGKSKFSKKIFFEAIVNTLKLKFKIM